MEDPGEAMFTLPARYPLQAKNVAGVNLWARSCPNLYPDPGPDLPMRVRLYL